MGTHIARRLRRRRSSSTTSRRMQVLPATIVIATLLIAPVVRDSNGARAANTSPGKKSAFASSDFGGNGDIPASGPPLLSVTLEKGKRKHVLAIEATLTSGVDLVPGALTFGVVVNGYEAEPKSACCGSFFTHPCGGACTHTGTWWFDLDAAESAHPGTFIGQQLTIELLGGEIPSNYPQGAGAVSMSVRMEKK